jgi:hypothetical protein
MGMLLRRHYPQAPESVVEVAENPSALSDMTVQELRGIAKENGVTGYSGLDKASLIDALEG